MQYWKHDDDMAVIQRYTRPWISYAVLYILKYVSEAKKDGDYVRLCHLLKFFATC
jgi:hypothetical protein